MTLKRKILFNLLLLFTNTILLLRYIFSENTFVNDSQSFLLLLFLLIAFPLISFNNKFLSGVILKSMLVKILMLCVVFIFLRGFFYETYGISVFANILLSAVIGFSILSQGLIFYFQLIYVAMVHLYVAYSYISGVLPSELLFSYSWNHISVILIHSTTLFYISYNHSDLNLGKYSLVPAISCFLLCLFSFGRSGMIASFLLMAFLLLFKIFRLLRSQNTLIKLGFAVLFSLTLYSFLYFYQLAENVDAFRTFEDRALDSAERSYILSSYLNYIFESPLSFLLGNHSDFFLNTIGIDPHNSYLAWHNYLGMSSFILIIYCFYTLVRLLRFNIIFASLLLTIFLRSFTDDVLLTDGVFFGSLLMFFVLYLEQCKSSFVKKIENSQRTVWESF